MKKTSIEKISEGFRLIVEDKPLKTPFGNDMILPTLALTEAIAKEWQAQDKTIQKDTMPLTQIACVAIDLARKKRDAVQEDLLAYCDTDLLCYRSGDIPELLILQGELFSPLILWAEKYLAIQLNITDGIMPVAQHPENKTKIAEATRKYDEWQFAVFASVVKPLSSAMLALALLERKIDAVQAFSLSHLEEEYETRKWGADDEKEQKMSKLRQDIFAAEEFLELLR